MAPIRVACLHACRWNARTGGELRRRLPGADAAVTALVHDGLLQRGEDGCYRLTDAGRVAIGR